MVVKRPISESYAGSVCDGLSCLGKVGHFAGVHYVGAGKDERVKLVFQRTVCQQNTMDVVGQQHGVQQHANVCQAFGQSGVWCCVHSIDNSVGGGGGQGVLPCATTNQNQLERVKMGVGTQRVYGVHNPFADTRLKLLDGNVVQRVLGNQFSCLAVECVFFGVRWATHSQNKRERVQISAVSDLPGHAISFVDLPCCFISF